MANSNQIRNTIIGTTVGGLLVAVILELFGMLPRLGKGLRIIGVWAWEFATWSMEVQAWMLGMLLCFAVPGALGFLMHLRHRFGWSEPDLNRELSSDEETVFGELTMYDGQAVRLEHLANGGKLTRLRTQEALAGLIESGLVKRNHTGSLRFELSPMGRRRALERNLA